MLPLGISTRQREAFLFLKESISVFFKSLYSFVVEKRKREMDLRYKLMNISTPIIFCG